MLVSLFITISGVISSQNPQQLLFQLIFIPIAIYFSYTAIETFFSKKKSPKKKEEHNKSALILTLVFFIVLLVNSILKISKKSTTVNNVSKKIVLTISPKPTPASFVTLKNDFINDKVNVRDSSSIKGKIIGQMENKPYLFLKKKDSWYEIIFNGKTHGFVNEEFVEIKK